VAANIEPEEAEAIQALARREGDGPGTSGPSAAEVVERDFREPRRLSRAGLERFRKRLQVAVPSLERALLAKFGEQVRLRIEEVREVNADGLFSTLEAPFAMGGFTVGEQSGWVRWGIHGAVHAVEHLLGSPASDEPRKLTGIENALLHDLLAVFVDASASALELDAADLRIVEGLEEVEGPDGIGSEPHRLAVSLSVDGLREKSLVHLWLPGVRDAGEPGKGETSALSLPPHLERVRVAFSAHLGASDVPLDDLLSLEIGDVVPLATGLSEPLVLRVEGQPCGTAEMGSVRGNRAVRIIEVNPVLEDIA
jgi:flagellar motor switch protein FliM